MKYRKLKKKIKKDNFCVWNRKSIFTRRMSKKEYALWWNKLERDNEDLHRLVNSVNSRMITMRAAMEGIPFFDPNQGLFLLKSKTDL